MWKGLRSIIWNGLRSELLLSNIEKRSYSKCHKIYQGFVIRKMEKRVECIYCGGSADFSRRFIQNYKQDEKGDGRAQILRCKMCDDDSQMLQLSAAALGPGSPKDPKKGLLCVVCGTPASVKHLQCKDCQMIYDCSCLDNKNAEYDKMTEEKKKNWRCKSCFTEGLLCVVCGTPASVKHLQCKDCQMIYDCSCLDIKNDEYDKMTEEKKKNWRCKSCFTEMLKDCGKNIGKHVAIAAGLSGACLLGVPLALGAAGFGATGVAAGSVAAAWQGAIGNVAAGSLFATCQSVGAAGLAASTQAGIVAVSSVIPFFRKKEEK